MANAYRERIVRSLSLEAEKLDKLNMPGMAKVLRQAAVIYRADWHPMRKRRTTNGRRTTH